MKKLIKGFKKPQEIETPILLGEITTYRAKQTDEGKFELEEVKGFMTIEEAYEYAKNEGYGEPVIDFEEVEEMENEND